MKPLSKSFITAISSIPHMKELVDTYREHFLSDREVVYEDKELGLRFETEVDAERVMDINLGAGNINEYGIEFDVFDSKGSAIMRDVPISAFSGKLYRSLCYAITLHEEWKKLKKHLTSLNRKGLEFNFQGSSITVTDIETDATRYEIDLSNSSFEDFTKMTTKKKLRTTGRMNKLKSEAEALGYKLIEA